MNSTTPKPPAPPRPRSPIPPTVAIAAAGVVAITVVDYLVPAGVVVGMLLTVPILMASLTDDRRWVYAIGAAAITGKLVEIAVGPASATPMAIWLPNRVLVVLSLPAFVLLAQQLQSRRLEAESTRDLNELLLSLLAHDLRSPLVLSAQTMQYVANSLARGVDPDMELVDGARERIQRSLRAIDVLLSVTREPAANQRASTSGGGIVAALEDELGEFARAAERSGKRIRYAHDGFHGEGTADVRILRQLLSILIDNAIRYADPGTLTVDLSAAGRTVVARVADEGPGLSIHRETRPRGEDAAGLGIQLASALALRAGGSLELERDGETGTTWAVRLPMARTA